MRAPVPVGIDEDERERLVFIDGEVPVPPYPDWSQSDTALASIAGLLRGLRDAARGFDPRDLTWKDALADPRGRDERLRDVRPWRVEVAARLPCAHGVPDDHRTIPHQGG